MTRRALIESTIQESLATKQRLLDDSNTLDALEQLATRIQLQLATGRKVLLAGNGGSAADAQHIAAEFVGRFEIERDALAAIALTTDTSALTAIGNDYGFEHVFARQVSGLGQAGDIFIGISTSGNSANIVRAMEVARSKGLLRSHWWVPKRGKCTRLLTQCLQRHRREQHGFRNVIS